MILTSGHWKSEGGHTLVGIAGLDIVVYMFASYSRIDIDIESKQ